MKKLFSLLNAGIREAKLRQNDHLRELSDAKESRDDHLIRLAKAKLEARAKEKAELERREEFAGDLQEIYCELKNQGAKPFGIFWALIGQCTTVVWHFMRLKLEVKIMETEHIFETIPRKMKIAGYLVCASSIIRILRQFLPINLPPRPNEQAFITFIIVVSLLVCLMGYKISQGKNWARIVFSTFPVVDFCGLWILSFVWEITPVPSAVIISTILMIAVELSVLIIAFSGESKQWFKKQKINQQQLSPAN